MLSPKKWNTRSFPYLLISKLLALLKLTAAGIIIHFFYATYIVHKIAKHLDRDMASQAAVTAESSMVPEVIFIYVFVHMMDL